MVRRTGHRVEECHSERTLLRFEAERQRDQGDWKAEQRSSAAKYALGYQTASCADDGEMETTSCCGSCSCQLWNNVVGVDVDVNVRFSDGGGRFWTIASRRERVECLH